MVLEDLKALHYELANRKERFDFKRTKLVLEKIAKLHAAGMVIHQKDPESMLYHQINPLDGDENPLVFFFSVSMQAVLETMRSSADLQKWVSTFENYDIVGEEKKIFAVGERLNVFNHGVKI